MRETKFLTLQPHAELMGAVSSRCGPAADAKRREARRPCWPSHFFLLIVVGRRRFFRHAPAGGARRSGLQKYRWQVLVSHRLPTSRRCALVFASMYRCV